MKRRKGLERFGIAGGAGITVNHRQAEGDFPDLSPLEDDDDAGEAADEGDDRPTT